MGVISHESLDLTNTKEQSREEGDQQNEQVENRY